MALNTIKSIASLYIIRMDNEELDIVGHEDIYLSPRKSQTGGGSSSSIAAKIWKYITSSDQKRKGMPVGTGRQGSASPLKKKQRKEKKNNCNLISVNVQDGNETQDEVSEDSDDDYQEQPISPLPETLGDSVKSDGTKRKRGRPRKTPGPPDINSTPKKRGRPRKLPLPNETQKVQMPKKKPGRPRKTPISPNTVSVTNGNGSDDDDHDINNDDNNGDDNNNTPRKPITVFEMKPEEGDVNLREQGLNLADMQGFVTASSSPMKTDSPKRRLSFTSPTKSPTKTLTTSPFKITLNKDFVPTPIPMEGEYQPPEEKHLTYFFDGFEGYIDQKKPIRSSKRSTNSMAMAPQLTREEFSIISNTLNGYLHKSTKMKLLQLQEQMFPQYWFELTQGFSLLFYGIGSKRDFLEQFAFEFLSPRLAIEYQHDDADYDEIEGVPCVVINGYNPTCNYRDAFRSITQIMLPEELSKSETKYWGNHVELQINKMIDIYRDEPPHIKLILLVHNLDGPSVRKDAFQNMLSLLSKVKQISLIASTDHIYAPLLWDHVRAQNFNFVYHDITNYESYTVESSFSDVMKLGRSDASTGAEGAKYVLESLTNNSKRMYKLLMETQLNNMDQSSNGKVVSTKRGSYHFGVEFKQFYHMCAAEFIASNELSLRSMLGEFIEHKMASISKDRAGAETVYVPYSYGEMQKLVKDVLSEH